MDVKIHYQLKGDVNKLLEQAKGQVMAQALDLLTKVVDEYLVDLDSHMGMPGGSSYRDKDVSWAALDEESSGNNPEFWYRTGEANKAIAVNIKVQGNKITAFAGIPSSSPAYEKALWNELGFSAADGNVIRRALFIPLAETHLAELNKRLRDVLQRMRIEIKVPV